MMDLHPIDVRLSSACDPIAGACVGSTSRADLRPAERREQVESRNAADPQGRRRCSRIALSFAIVGGTRAECMTLPDGALISRAAEGARRAAEACNRLGLRATFLVPGAHVSHHLTLLRALTSQHEIGLYGFDPVRPAPDDPFRGREALTVALGRPVHWYRPAFGAPTAEAAIVHVGLARVPNASSVRLAGCRFSVEHLVQHPRLFGLSSRLATAALERTLERALMRALVQVEHQARDTSDRGMSGRGTARVLHIHCNVATTQFSRLDGIAALARA